jgi:AcrR family transcriptional regulator
VPYRPTERTRARLAVAREAIVDAAHDQLAEGGYASASVVTVARRAGVATGTVYRHFPSKSDLFAEVFRRASQREVDALGAVRGDTVAARLEGMVDAFVRRALAQPVRAFALIAEPVDAAVEAERLSFRRAYADLFADAVREGARRGELPAQDADLSAAAIVGGLAEALVGPLARRDSGADALVAGLERFILNATGAHARHAAAA